MLHWPYTTLRFLANILDAPTVGILTFIAAAVTVGLWVASRKPPSWWKVLLGTAISAFCLFMLDLCSFGLPPQMDLPRELIFLAGMYSVVWMVVRVFSGKFDRSGMVGTLWAFGLLAVPTILSFVYAAQQVPEPGQIVR